MAGTGPTLLGQIWFSADKQWPNTPKEIKGKEAKNV